MMAWWTLATMAIRPVRQALDHVELPQRPGPVERARGEVGHQLGELRRCRRGAGMPVRRTW